MLDHSPGAEGLEEGNSEADSAADLFLALKQTLFTSKMTAALYLQLLMHVGYGLGRLGFIYSLSLLK